MEKTILDLKITSQSKVIGTITQAVMKSLALAHRGWRHSLGPLSGRIEFDYF